MNDNYVGVVVVAIALFGFLLGAWRHRTSTEHRRLTARVRHLERQIQVVQDRLGIAPDPGGFPEVVTLLADGKRIKAIQVYREATGATLRQAKEAVDRII